MSIATCERVRLTLAQRLRHAPRGEADSKAEGRHSAHSNTVTRPPAPATATRRPLGPKAAPFEGRSPRSQHRHELTARTRAHVRRATVGEDHDEVPGGRVERDVRDGVAVAREPRQTLLAAPIPQPDCAARAAGGEEVPAAGANATLVSAYCLPSPVDTDATCAPSATRRTRSVPSPAAARGAPPGEKATPSTLENPPSRRISFPVRQRPTRTSSSSPAAARASRRREGRVEERRPTQRP